jgi:hypothetical protein
MLGVGFWRHVVWRPKACLRFIRYLVSASRPSASVCQSWHVVSQGFSTLKSRYCVGVRTLSVATLNVGFPVLCRMVSEARTRFDVGVGTASFATLSVGLTVSRRMASQRSPSFYSESDAGVGAIGVALSVGFPLSSGIVPRGSVASRSTSYFFLCTFRPVINTLCIFTSV